MKIRHIFSSFLSASCALVLFTQQPVGAQQATVTEGVSKHYASVAKHLELGGAFYAYMDVDDDMANLSELLDSGLQAAAKQGIDLPKIDTKKVLRELGIGSLKAFGMSSRKQGENFHNKMFLAMPEGITGLMKVLGGKAGPLLSSKLAPAGTDLIVEEDFSLKALLDSVEGILSAAKGENSTLEEIKAGMDQALAGQAGPLPFTMRQVIEKMDTKLTLIARLNEKKPIQIPDLKGVEIPGMEIMLSLDNMDWLFGEAAKMLTEGGQFALAKGDGYEMLKSMKPMPAPISDWAPVIYLDNATRRVFIATSLDFVTECLSQKTTVTADAEYKETMVGLPTEGNGLSYASKQLTESVLKLLPEFMQANNKKMGLPAGDADSGMEFMKLFLPKKASGMGSVRVNMEDGILLASNSFESHKSTLLSAAVYPLAIVGAVAARSMAQLNPAGPMGPRMRLEPDAEEKAEADAPPAGPMPRKISPEQRVKSNLTQIAFAAEGYFLDDTDAKEVEYGTLIKRGFLFKPAPVGGEDYSGLKVKRSGGTLSVELSNGTQVEHKYPAVTD